MRDGKNLGGWQVIEHRDERHVIPVNDIKEHKPERCECFATPCPDDLSVIVHHSFDGRENFEYGDREVS